MPYDGFLAAARSMVPNITTFELTVLAGAWIRLNVDGESEADTTRWARRELGMATPVDEVIELRAEGASLRQIAAQVGVSRMTVSRLLAQHAA